ncbi:hypothetical protein HMPREF9072_00566, partial [Capnocytophaga sp. oral taxon 324 str. F0483]
FNLPPLFLRHLFVHCSSFVRLFFVFSSSLFHFCVATFPLFEEASESWVCVRGRFYLSFLYLPVVLRLPVWLAPARVARTVFPISFSQINH